MQVLQHLQGQLRLSGAAALQRQGFLDTAAELLTRHEAESDKPSQLRKLLAELGLRIAMVRFDVRRGMRV